MVKCLIRSRTRCEGEKKRLLKQMLQMIKLVIPPMQWILLCPKGQGTYISHNHHYMFGIQ